MTERHVELHRAARAEREVGAAAAGLEIGPRGRSVHEHDHLGLAFGDRGGRVTDHELPRAAADAGAVGPRRPETEVLGHLDRREQARAVGAEAVDVGLGETGVRDRAARRLVVQLERRLGVDPPDVGQRRADDRNLATHDYPRRCASMPGFSLWKW